MLRLTKHTYTRGPEYNIIYSSMRGVDLRGDGGDISRSRFAYCENLYRDYGGGGGEVIESIPGFRKLRSFPGKIDNIFVHKTENETFFLIHTSGKLYRVTRDNLENAESYTEIAVMENTEASSYSFGDSLFILCTDKLLKIDASGQIYSSASNLQPYIPTTYINGEEVAQRNILTRVVNECFIAGSADTMAYGTPQLNYKITDSEKRECQVVSLGSGSDFDIYVPSRVKLGGEYYSVVEIADGAFEGNGGIRSVTVANGVLRIGKFAFANAAYMQSVILPDSVTFIDNAAFSQCYTLNHLHIGTGLVAFGAAPFSFCSNLKSIDYAGDSVAFSYIENTSVLGDITVNYRARHERCTIAIPIFEPAVWVSSVKVDGTSQGTFYTTKKGDIITEVILSFENRSQIEGKEIIINCTLSNNGEDYASGGFIKSKYASQMNIASLLVGCRCAAIFDGRPFLSGSPGCPGSVFFASRDDSGLINPLYFGENDFFQSYGENEVISMLPTADSLAVFSRDARSEVTISYHTPTYTEFDLLPITYKRSGIHSGLGNVYSSISFFDDPLFLSDNGVIGLEKRKTNLEKNITCRSGNVNPLLLTENLAEAKLGIWCGYLVLAAGERIYLADSRASFTGELGSLEYEWFLLNQIGAYEGDKTVYRYSSISPAEGLLTKSNYHDTGVSESITPSSMIKDGLELFYTVEDGNSYSVYPTTERYGGSFYPLCSMVCFDDLFYFGTSGGSLCVFNNDMRGVAPDSLLLSDDFNEEQYKKLYGNKIDRSFYSFAGHAVKYALSTPLDNGGIPHLTKSTIKNSLTMKLRASPAEKIICEVDTGEKTYSEACAYPGSKFQFDDLDFSALAFISEENYTKALAEREKGWVDKQISVFTEGFCSPIAIYNIAYRFTVKGRIKKNN